MALHNITQAAKLVGVSRSTFYRHIEDKGISTTPDDKGNPVVDTSELLRVYGTLKGDTPSETHHAGQVGTVKKDSPDTALQTELEVLRERLAARDDKIATLETELQDWKDQAKQALRLLTDQRPATPAPVADKPADPAKPQHAIGWLARLILRRTS